jgi:hypothetical protein
MLFNSMRLAQQNKHNLKFWNLPKNESKIDHCMDLHTVWNITTIVQAMLI